MLVIQYVPYADLRGLSQEQKLIKLLSLVKEGKILLVEGTLTSEEQSAFITKTMQEITDSFTGIELASLSRAQMKTSFTSRFRSLLAKFLLGNQAGMTIIGPAPLVREIKRDPEHVQVLLEEWQKPKKKK